MDVQLVPYHKGQPNKYRNDVVDFGLKDGSPGIPLSATSIAHLATILKDEDSPAALPHDVSTKLWLRIQVRRSARGLSLCRAGDSHHYLPPSYSIITFIVNVLL